MVGSVFTDIVTSVEHQTDTHGIKKHEKYWRGEGAPVTNSNVSLRTTGRPLGAFKAEI